MSDAGSMITGLVVLCIAVAVPLLVTLLLIRWLWRVNAIVDGIERCAKTLREIRDRQP